MGAAKGASWATGPGGRPRGAGAALATGDLGAMRTCEVRLPAAVKIALAVPLVMALLGAEVELRLSPQIDVIATVVGICVIWAWLSGGPSASA